MKKVSKKPSLKEQIRRLKEKNESLEKRLADKSWDGQVDGMSGAFRQDEIDNAHAWR